MIHGLIFKEAHHKRGPTATACPAGIIALHPPSFTHTEISRLHSIEDSKSHAGAGLQWFMLFSATDTVSSVVRAMICKCITRLFMHFVYAVSRFQTCFAVLSNTFCFLRAVGFDPASDDDVNIAFC